MNFAYATVITLAWLHAPTEAPEAGVDNVGPAQAPPSTSPDTAAPPAEGPAEVVV